MCAIGTWPTEILSGLGFRRCPPQLPARFLRVARARHCYALPVTSLGRLPVGEGLPVLEAWIQKSYGIRPKFVTQGTDKASEQPDGLLRSTEVQAGAQASVVGSENEFKQGNPRHPRRPPSGSGRGGSSA